MSIRSFEVAKQRMFLCIVSSFFASTAVHSLKCAHLDVVCLSPTPAANCTKSSQQMTCPGVADSCANISTEIQTEAGLLRSYFYGCATQKMCKNAEEHLKVICQNVTREGYNPKCSVSCCKTDFCVPLDVTSGARRVASALSQPFKMFSVLFVLSRGL